MFNEVIADTHYPVSATYHIIDDHQIGAPLIWSFLFSFLKIIGFGYKSLLNVAVNLSDYMLGILSLLLIYKIAIRFFDKRSALLGILSVLFGTNMFAYITLLSGGSHATSLFFTSCFLSFYFYTQGKRTTLDWLIWGGVAGFAVMTRGDSVLYLILSVICLFEYVKQKKFKHAIMFALIFSLGFIFTLSPQLIFWKIVFGKIFRIIGEYDYSQGYYFLKVLFSPHRGFIFFSPILFLCFFIGLFTLYKKDKALTFASIFSFLGLVYGIGKLKFAWGGGYSFGPRYFVSFYPFFILGVIACFERISLNKQKVIAIMSFLWSSYLFLIYKSNIEIQSYKFINKLFSRDTFYKISHSLSLPSFFGNVVFKFIFLKLALIVFIFTIIFLLYHLYKRLKIPGLILKRASVYLAAGLIVYINSILVRCSFNDQKIILKLKQEGFYNKKALFGGFDKYDVAGCYLEYAEEEAKAGNLETSIAALKRAVDLDPFLWDNDLMKLYNIYSTRKNFNEVFMKNPDANLILGLSLICYEKKDLESARYYFKEAIKIDPRITAIVDKWSNHELRPLLERKISQLSHVQIIDKTD